MPASKWYQQEQTKMHYAQCCILDSDNYWHHWPCDVQHGSWQLQQNYIFRESISWQRFAWIFITLQPPPFHHLFERCNHIKVKWFFCILYLYFDFCTLFALINFLPTYLSSYYQRNKVDTFNLSLGTIHLRCRHF